MRYRGLLIALPALLGTGGAAAPGTALQEEAGEFARRVADSASVDSERELERRASELARMPGAIDSYFAITAAGGLPGADGQWVPLGRSQLQLLEWTTTLLDSSVVVSYVRTGLTAPSDESWRRIALGLIGSHGSSSQLSMLAQLTLDSSGAKPRPGLVEPFSEALTALLRREGVRSHELRWLAAEAEPLTEAIVRAVGRTGAPEGLVWLATRMEDPQVGMAALQEIGRLARTATGEGAAGVATAVHLFLQSGDEARRRCAIRALSALRQPASVPRLVLHLGRAGSTGERKMTYAALRTLSGVNLPDDAAAWRNWYEREHRWFQEASEAALEKLSSEDVAEVVAAMKELSQHTLHRDRIAEPLAALLSSHPSPAVRGKACLALGCLGSERSLAKLVVALEDDSRDVQLDASRALCAITGLSLGTDAGDWEDALQSRATARAGPR